MTQHSTAHDTFVINRNFPFPREIVFAAWADVAAKARWFVGPQGWEMQRRELDFRAGGEECLAGRFPDGRTSRFMAHYYDIVPNERIIYAYEMFLNDVRLSVSVATIEFKERGDGTLLVITEQGVFLEAFDGPRGREEGTRVLVGQLERALQGS